MGETLAAQARARLLHLIANGACRAVPALCRACGREFDLAGHPPGATIACPGCRASLEAPPPPPSATPGRYRVLEPIGRGAMGTVYHAVDELLGRDVALKVVAHANVASPANLERFRREAQAMAQVDHPNVVKLFDVGDMDGDPYLVMELIRGENLAHAFAQRPLRARVELIEKVARAVHAAHERGVIHRDLKPQNVLIDERGEPHVMDFGLARLEDGAPLTRDGLAIGTPPYMAPEQLRADPIDARTDVFAMGAMLYESLTAQVPFPGGTVAETFQAILTTEPTPPRALNARVPADLETICLRALEKEPGRRYATAEALANDLRRYLDGEAVEARRPAAPERFVRFLRRRRAVVIPVCVAAAGMLAVWIALQVTMPWVRSAETNWREWQERARAAEQRAAALARVNAALDRALDLVYDGGARPDELRARANEARQTAHDMTQLIPTLVEGYVARGRALRLLGDDDGARADFDRALRRYPGYAEAYYERGRLRMERALRTRFTLGRDDEAEIAEAAQDFEAAARCGAAARREMHLASLCVRFLRQDPQGAVEEASRVIAQGGRVEDYLYLRGLGQAVPEKAVADFQEALRRRPNDAWMRFACAVARAELKDHAGAVEDLSRAIALRPNFAEAYLKRGICARHLKDYARAVADLEKALALGQDARAELDEARRLLREDH